MIHALVFITALLTVYFAVPQLIEISIKKGLFDAPVESRKIHTRVIPNLGGVALFTGFLFASVLFVRADELPQANLILGGGLIIFMIGLSDDLIGAEPKTKLIFQLASALIITVWAGIRIPIASYELTQAGTQIDAVLSIFITVVFIVGVINAYNLTDGIDTLCASQALIGAITFACLFYLQEQRGWSVICLALAGAILGFLIFNATPAKLFMGDSGSLLLGFLLGVMAIKFLVISIPNVVHVGNIRVDSPLGVIMAIMIVPIFDTLRVFTLRTLKKTSPFKADRNHMHHRLLQLGLTHMQASGVLACVTILFIILSIALQKLGNLQLLSLLFFIAIMINWGFTTYLRYMEKQKKKQLNLL